MHFHQIGMEFLVSDPLISGGKSNFQSRNTESVRIPFCQQSSARVNTSTPGISSTPPGFNLSDSSLHFSKLSFCDLGRNIFRETGNQSFRTFSANLGRERHRVTEDFFGCLIEITPGQTFLSLQISKIFGQNPLLIAFLPPGTKGRSREGISIQGIKD
jgi:hypothetical protein